MKLRKLAALALSAVMCVSTVLTAGAAPAQSADAQLAKVTRQVKTTLSIPDTYKDFSGQPYENYLGTRWNLNWRGDDGSLHVTATNEGKVLSMSRDEASSSRGDRYDPHFPTLTSTQAQQKAQAFLSNVLTAGETARFYTTTDLPSPSRESVVMRGSIDLNAIPSPLGFTIRVRLTDGTVMDFNRDDVSDYVGDLPEAKSATEQKAAAELLKGVLALRLEYVRDGEKAVLRYLPEERDDYYVDAATGKLVNLSELQKELFETAESTAGGAGNGSLQDAAAPAASAAPEEEQRKLTAEELAGIAKLEELLTADQLEQKARAWTELALDGFERASADYTVDKDEDKVTAQLTFVKRVEEKEKRVARRYVTMDAKTGALEAVAGYNPYSESDQAKLDMAAAQAKAEAFLKSVWPALAAQTELYSSNGGEKGYPVYTFEFAQKKNGYFFPENMLTVRVDGISGAVIGLYCSYDEKIVFDSPAGIISQDKALDIWAGSYPMALSYVSVPVRLDLLGEEAKPLLDAGISYYNALKPGYGLDWGEAYYEGVDAKTGKLVEWKGYASNVTPYTDISGHAAETALKELAEFQVGWSGGKAMPDAALTQKDLIILLSSAAGYNFYPEEESVDSLYEYAYYNGYLEKGERADNKALTRLETVEMLINALGYRTVAGLSGIYRCDYKDADKIPADALGYAALAQGLGIVPADNGTSFDASGAATRADAALMLWRYMKG